MSAILDIIAACLKIALELFSMKSEADKKGEKFKVDESRLYEASRRLLEKAQQSKETEEAKKIDEQLDSEWQGHQKK